MPRSSYTIAVVDDHEPTRYAAARTLQALGYNTVEAASGEEAIAIGLETTTSAVLLDVNLPDVNGVKVCQVLKAARPVPIVLMSAVYMDALHRGAALESGADAYLVPPLESQELASTFDGFLLAQS